MPGGPTDENSVFTVTSCHFLTGKSLGGGWAQPELRALGEEGTGDDGHFQVAWALSK